MTTDRGANPAYRLQQQSVPLVPRFVELPFSTRGSTESRATARPPILCLFSERSVAGFLHRRFAYPCQNDLIEAPNRNLALTVQKYRDTFRVQIKNNDQRSGIRIVIIGLWRKLIFGQN
jgi:hypothetical protein